MSWKKEKTTFTKVYKIEAFFAQADLDPDPYSKFGSRSSNLANADLDPKPCFYV